MILSNTMRKNNRRERDENIHCQDEEISIFNKSLSLLGESPLDKCKLQTLKSYIPEKKLKKFVKRKLDLLSSNSNAIAFDASEDDDYEASKKKLSNPCADGIVKVLQDKYKSTQSKCENIMILTIFVAQWSNRKVRREFNFLHQLVSQTKEV